MDYAIKIFSTEAQMACGPFRNPSWIVVGFSNMGMAAIVSSSLCPETTNYKCHKSITAVSCQAGYSK